MDDCKCSFEKTYYHYKNLMFQADPLNNSCSQKLQYPERTALFWKLLLQMYLLYSKVHSQVWDNFWQLKALYKWRKMLFISPEKLLSFSRYLSFLSWLFGLVTKRLDKKDKVNFKFYDVTHWLTSNRNTHIAQYFEK